MSFYSITLPTAVFFPAHMITLKFYSIISEGTLKMELSPLFPVPFNYVIEIKIINQPKQIAGNLL